MKQIRWIPFSLLLATGLLAFVISIYAAFSYILETSKASVVNQAYDYFVLLQAQQQTGRLAHRLRLASIDPQTANPRDMEQLHLVEQLGLAWARVTGLREGENAKRLREVEGLATFTAKVEEVFEQLELTLDKDLGSSLYQENPNYGFWYEQVEPLYLEFSKYTNQQDRLLVIQEDLQQSQNVLNLYFAGILSTGFFVLAMYVSALISTIRTSRVLRINNAHLSEAKEALAYQASHDALTSLVNRYEFESRLQQLLNSAQQTQKQHALCYIDLDQFKLVNDTCGHSAGDELLRQLSALLKAQVRSQDTLSRLGGDEFAALLIDADNQVIEEVAEAMREAAHNFRFLWEQQLFDIAISIGVVKINQHYHAGNIANILSDADAACYVAKEGGRNRVHIFEADDQEIIRHKGEMAWVSRINQAFEENRFVLFHQPIVPVDPAHKEKLHYEVLVRMLDEEGKIIPPGFFMPAAERYNLMPNLDRWVVENLFAYLMSHPERLDLLEVCSVNLSGLSISDAEFIDFLDQIIAQYKMPTEKICFEVTETAAIANLTKATSFIKHFKEVGCRFSLDDFGSGMSSFGYLKNLPVDYLKIDGSFVKEITSDQIDRAMVEAIHRVGNVMGLCTIAEYVENGEILQELGHIGVNYAQGYGIAKPSRLDG